MASPQSSIESYVSPADFAADPYYRLGRWVYAHRWLVLAVWGVLILAALPAAPAASRSLSPGGFSTSRLEATRATQSIQAALGENPSALLVIFSHPSLQTNDPAYF